MSEHCTSLPSTSAALPADITRAALTEIAASHGLTLAGLFCRDRRAHAVAARWKALDYLVNERGYSQSAAGRYIGMDHSSVCYALGRAKHSRYLRRRQFPAVAPIEVRRVLSESAIRFGVDVEDLVAGRAGPTVGKARAVACLRLRELGLGNARIAQEVGIQKKSVHGAIRRARELP